MQKLLDRLYGGMDLASSTQSIRRLSETLFNLIQSARLRLFPERELEKELLSLNVVQKGYGWRIDHASGGYSDRAIALGMMALQALETDRDVFAFWV